jgi:pimeloyl-ACP methyl ester carboxylesterase
VLFTLFFDQRLDDRMGLSFYNVDAYIDPHAIDLAHEVMARPGYMAAALAAARGMRYEEMAKGYKKIKNRVLIIHGEYDPVTRLPWAKRLHGELPNSRLVVIPNTKHMPMFAAAPQVLRALRPFLAGLEPGQAIPRAAPPPAPREPSPPPSPETPPASAPTLPPPEPEDEVMQ